MTMSDRIEAAAKEKAAISEAWDTYKVIANSPPDEESFTNGVRWGIEIGRREVLQGLYQQLSPEEVLRNLSQAWTYWASVNGEFVKGMVWVNGKNGKPKFDIFLDGTQNGKRKDIPLEKCDFLLCLKDANEFPTPGQAFGTHPRL